METTNQTYHFFFFFLNVLGFGVSEAINRGFYSSVLLPLSSY